MVSEKADRSPGSCREVNSDRDGNRSIAVTDAAGRRIEERFEGVYGAIRSTVYGYDEFGRQKSVHSPDGSNDGLRIDTITTPRAR